jgi:hypothetical protein
MAGDRQKSSPDLLIFVKSMHRYLQQVLNNPAEKEKKRTTTQKNSRNPLSEFRFSDDL